MLFEDEEEKEIDKGEIEKESDTFDSELYDELHLSKELNFLGNENCIMFEYEEDGKTKGFAISSHDIESIKYGQYLNDTIINFYLK